MKNQLSLIFIRLITGVFIMLFTQATIVKEISAKEISSPNNNDQLKHSPQYNNGTFKGEIDALTMTASDYLSSTWRFLFEKNNQNPNSNLPFQPVDLSFFNNTKTDQLNSTWLGHSSLMINMGGFKILTDPVFERKVSIVGPKRFNREFPLDPMTLADIDVVMISHDHYDHLNKASIKQLDPITHKFVVPLAVGKRLKSWGVAEDKIIEMDWWDSFLYDENLKITATPAQHFSGRGIGDRNKTLWASWVIETDQFKIFFSGDSGYFNGFKTIGDKFGPFDMTFLECGAYDKLWKPVHMFPEETVQAHIDLKGKLLHPIHWGTFNLALHSWYEPMQRLTKAARIHGISSATPIAGQSILYGSNLYGSPWWENALINKSITQK